MTTTNKSNNSQTHFDVEDSSTLQKDRPHLLSLLFLAVVAGFLGGLLAHGLFINQTFTGDLAGVETRQQLVLQESEVIAEVAEEVGPSVVSISARSPSEGFFFNTEGISLGSGIIIDKSGLVVTNKHVIPNNPTSLTVIAADGTEYQDVVVIDRDPFNDIAYLRINGVDDLKPVSLGNSSTVKVGEKVIAIGNALGQFNNTVTAGIISGTSRPIVAGGQTSAPENLTNLFQTDAAINPGNSGGPLVNLNGEVIGINTAMAEAENIGFAIPIDDVKPGIASVRQTGELIKPYLGVRYVMLNPAIARELALERETGAYIFASDSQPAVLPGSPADKAGLQRGDIILEVNDQPVTLENGGLGPIIGRQQVGDTVMLTIERNGKEQAIEVILEAVPDGLSF